MSLLHDAYTALLSGLTHKTGNEIHWYNKDGCPITVEPIDIESESYMVRRYREDGSLRWEINYLQDQPHGKCLGWHYNGQLHWETDYVNGQRHGKHIGWSREGEKSFEYHYINDLSTTLEEWEQHDDSTT